MSDDKSPPVPPAGASWIFEQLKDAIGRAIKRFNDING